MLFNLAFYGLAVVSCLQMSISPGMISSTHSNASITSVLTQLCCVLRTPCVNVPCMFNEIGDSDVIIALSWCMLIIGLVVLPIWFYATIIHYHVKKHGLSEGTRINH